MAERPRGTDHDAGLGDAVPARSVPPGAEVWSSGATTIM
jgi:hypothetical protein